MKSNLHPVDPKDVKKVLIVEDDKDLIEVLKVLMRDVFPKASVQTAHNMEEAIRLLNPGQAKQQVQLPYDLVLADIFLNGPGTGLDLLRLCRSVYPGLHLLLSSAMPRNQLADLLKGEELPEDYLQKPFSLEDCREKIRSAVYRN